MIFSRSWLSFILMVVLTMILAACGGDSETPQTLPTAIVIPTQPSQQQNTTDDEPTPTQEVPTATRQPGTRPTLPPTWTPEPSLTPEPVTDTPVPGDSTTITGDSQAAGPPTIPPGCTGFGVDTTETDEEIILGQPARVAWQSVAGAGAYWIVVYDASNDAVDPATLPVIHEDFISNTAYTIPAEVFRAPVRYGWEVRPLDSVGIQMCQGRGGLILVRN